MARTKASRWSGAHGRLAGDRVVAGRPGRRERDPPARPPPRRRAGHTAPARSIPPIPGPGRRAGRGTTATPPRPRRSPAGSWCSAAAPIGAELAQAFKRLGSDEVTVVEGDPRLLAREEPFAGEQVAKSPSRPRASHVVTGVAIAAVRRDGSDGPVTATLADGRIVEADEILVAVGRRPATARPRARDGRPRAWRQVPRRRRPAPRRRRAPAAGCTPWATCNGLALLTHMGKYQARLAGDVIAGRTSATSPTDGDRPRVTFTDPQVCRRRPHRGPGARQQGLNVRVVDLRHRRRGRRLHARATASAARPSW